MSSLYNPMVCSPPGSSVHAIFQARILEWVAMPSSKGSTWLRDGTHISCIASPKLLYHLIHQGKSACVCVCVCVCVCIIDMNICNILIYTYIDRWASLVAQLVKNPLKCRRPQSNSWAQKIPGTGHRLPTPVFLGFPSDSKGKESAWNEGDLGLIPGSRRFFGGGNDNSPRYSCLENLHGQRNLVGYSPWDHKESDMIKWLSTAQHR